MPKVAKPVCGKGHDKPLDAACSQCARERALARYDAKRDSINAARRGVPRPVRKMARDDQGRPVCPRGHVRREGIACQVCRAESNRAKADGLCKNGLHPWVEGARTCGECYDARQSVWRADHRDSENEKALANYYRRKGLGLKVNDPERVASWKRNNRERVRELNRQWAERNPDAVKAKNDAWRAANPERVNAIGRASVNRRRVRMAGNLGSHTEAEFEAVCARQRGLCAYCGLKAKLTRDHVVPVSRGGCDYILNIVGACKPCNSRKRALLKAGTQLSVFDRVGGIGA